jgi:DNA ligase-4
MLMPIYFLQLTRSLDEWAEYQTVGPVLIFGTERRLIGSTGNMLYFNHHGYFERVLFARSVPEFDIGFDHGWRLQTVELFKRPFSVELVDASFDRPANTSYFALRFPRMLRIHDDHSFKDTVSFGHLRTVAF